jgi:hypothetical protein
MDAWKETLEDAVDLVGIDVVLEALSDICTEKEHHVATNWQDQARAAAWGKIGVKIDRILPAVRNLDPGRVSQ